MVLLVQLLQTGPMTVKNHLCQTGNAPQKWLPFPKAWIKHLILDYSPLSGNNSTAGTANKLQCADFISQVRGGSRDRCTRTGIS